MKRLISFLSHFSHLLRDFPAISTVAGCRAVFRLPGHWCLFVAGNKRRLLIKTLSHNLCRTLCPATFLPCMKSTLFAPTALRRSAWQLCLSLSAFVSSTMRSWLNFHQVPYSTLHRSQSPSLPLLSAEEDFVCLPFPLLRGRGRCLYTRLRNSLLRRRVSSWLSHHILCAMATTHSFSPPSFY